METRQALVLVFVLFSCYLIISLAPVSAYVMGDVFSQADEKVARLSIDPVLKIIDEIKPVECESQGTTGFRAYVENVGEFDITSMEALIEDATSGTYYNVTNAVSCGPMANLISNQEIACTLNVKTLLAKLPACPLESTGNRLYISFEIAQEQSGNRVTDSKAISIIGAGIEPSMEADFYVSRPPYPVPVINCNAGSEIDVPVVIRHAEKLFGSISWSFAANGTSSNMIECSKLHSTEDDGRNDIYLCTLTVSSIMYPKCEEGAETNVGIFARAGEFNLTGTFSTTLTSQDLNLGLKISGVDSVDCQIVSEDGLCIPDEPQKNVTVTITGNVPEHLRVFESRFKLDSDNVSALICKKLSSDRYQCMTFITPGNLPVPSDKNNMTTKEREMTIYFDVKYLNYYTSVSAKTTFEMRGTALDELINTLALLERDKDFFNDLQDVSKWLNKGYTLLNTLSMCCYLVEMVAQLATGNVGEALKMFAKSYLWGDAKNGFSAVLNILIKYGPGILSCIAEKSIEEIDDEMKNLQDFEKGAITREMEVPTFGEQILDHFPECTAQNFWSQIKSSKWGWLCAAFMIILIVATSGSAASICLSMQESGLSTLTKALNILLSIVSAILLYLSLTFFIKDIALSRERMNLQLAASNMMSEYAEKLQATMQSLATSLSLNSAFVNITSPSYGTTKLLFISDRVGVLNNGDAICTQDMITIDYDLEKLNQTEGFKPELFISSSSHSKTLHFDELKGTKGPYDTDALLGTSPSTDPSELYTFRLTYAGRSLDYQLNYMNQPCGSE